MKPIRMYTMIGALLTFSVLSISIINSTNIKTLVETYMMSGNVSVKTDEDLQEGKRNETYMISGNVSVTTEEDFQKGNINAPSVEREFARRAVEQDTAVFWNYMHSQLLTLKNLVKKGNLPARIDNMIDYGRELQGALRNDLADLSNEVDQISEWRNMESVQLESLIQTRFDKMQNPKDCSKAKRIVCRIWTDCGFGCTLHHITNCMIMAYSSNRTLILLSKGWQYDPAGWEAVFQPLSRTCNATHAGEKGRIPMWGKNANITNDDIVEVPRIPNIPNKPNLHPRAIPDDIADTLIRFHRKPILWWVGQLKKYLMRPREYLTRFIEDKQKKLNFTHPIVGVHIRRTDKKSEAKYHDVDEYMRHVVDWYDTYEQRHPGVERKVFIATDDPSCVKEAKENYPNYTFINDNEVAQSASLKNRYNNSSLIGLMMEVHFLSNSDYFVCTLSSTMARMIYELMQTIHGDASNLVTSVDRDYFYHGETRYSVETVVAHTAKHGVSDKEIDVQVGDTVLNVRNWKNGFSKGTNKRTRQTGLFPSYKVKDEVIRVKREDFLNV